MLSEYIETGWSVEFGNYEIKELLQDPEKLENLFRYYTLLDNLDVVEMKNWVEGRIVDFIRAHCYDTVQMRTCLMLAIQCKMNRAISASVPTVLAVYWESIDQKWQQRAFVNKRLLDEALPNLGTTYTSINIAGYKSKLDSERSKLPKEISELFPNLQAIKWYTENQVPCVLYVENVKGESFLVRRNDSWQTKEWGKGSPSTLNANIQIINDEWTDMNVSADEANVEEVQQSLSELHT